MKFTYSWLKEHLETTASPEVIAEKLTALGLEVEEFTDTGKKYAPFIVAEILEATKHPNADKLQVCKVTNGSEVLQIVCGAPNARAGIKVVLAPVGAEIPNGNFQIKKSKIRDVESNGMLCSAGELELGSDSAGIIELPATAKTGQKYAEFASLNDSFYEIAITPNRADCLGVRGIARDLAAAELGTLKPLASLPSNTACLWIKIENVTNGGSPEWLKNRLTSIGLAPISALVDITNFITFDLGRPLHVYDADKIKGNLGIKMQRDKAKFNALNNKTYELENDLVIADANGAVAIAGVIGNIESSVDASTKNVLLEIAYFEPAVVAASGRKHLIDSDARYRFERGVDSGFLATGAEVASKLITKICGGKVSETKTFGEIPNTKREINFDLGKIKTFGNLDISQPEALKILSNLGFQLNSTLDSRLSLTPPSWRADIEGEADIIEELLRISGYDKPQPQILPFAPRKNLPPLAAAKNSARATLANRGLVETVTYSFLEPKTARIFGGGNAALNLQNPISAELAEMRPSILPNLLQAAVKNSNRGFKNFGLFEIGPVFSEKEVSVIGGIRIGQNSGKNIYGKPRNIDAFDAKADLLSVIGNFGELREGTPEHYHPGRSGSVYLGKNILGYFGEIHPAVLKKLGVEQNAVGFEVFIENLPQTARKFKKFEASDLQEVSRDFAFVLPAAAKAGDIAPKVKKADKLISKVVIFDLYEGANLGAGKKSIAFSATITPQEKTLADAEIEQISLKIINIVKTELGGELRS